MRGRYSRGGEVDVKRGRGIRRVSALLLVVGVCLAVLMPVSQAPAVPAYDGPVEYTQPEGTKFVARQGGDEWKNWTSTDGKLIVEGADGFWCYATVMAGGLASTGARVGIDAVPARTASEAEASKLSSKAPAAMEATRAEPPLRALSGPQPTLVLLVQFSDRTLTTSLASWQTAFFGASGKTLRTYYNEATYNSFYFSAANETQGTTNDGIVTVTLGYNHPNTGTSTGDANRQIVRNALIAADSYVNFAAYDTNFSGGLSTSELHIVTVVAGYERAYDASSPSVWAHRWSLFGSVLPPYLDSVYVAGFSYGGGYTQQGELHDGHQATIGILCHELGHDVGLPDLYDTDGGSEGIGGHGVMGSGSWGAASGEFGGASPTHFCGWSKVQLGVVSPTVLTCDGPFMLGQASSVGYGMIKLTTSDPNQYFLLENRQLTGFDAGLYRWFSTTSGGTGGGGLAIWHIDMSQSGNTNEARKLVDLEEANEGILGYSELDTQANRGNRHHYYYLGHRTDFDNATTPNSRLYSGASTGIDVSSVSSAGSTMTGWISIGVPPKGFGIKNLAGTLVSMIDKRGNLLVKGSVTPNSTPVATSSADFLVKDNLGNVVAAFDTSGNVVLAGSLYTAQSTLTPPARSFVVKDSGGNVVGYISTTGEMRIRGMVAALP